MFLVLDYISCVRCGVTFPRPHLSGRRPIYCGRTCRQRAYEARRRAAYQHHLPGVPRPTRPRRELNLLYETGRRRGICHALRPDQAPASDHRRQTLCGTHVWSISRLRFGMPQRALGRDCKTCTAVAAAYPLTNPLDPPADLARVKHLLLANRASWLAGHLDTASATLEELYDVAIGRDAVVPPRVGRRPAA